MSTRRKDGQKKNWKPEHRRMIEENNEDYGLCHIKSEWNKKKNQSKEKLKTNKWRKSRKNKQGKLIEVKNVSFGILCKAMIIDFHSWHNHGHDYARKKRNTVKGTKRERQRGGETNKHIQREMIEEKNEDY